jgi:Holliday junction resolvasome RuvABC endonuclease subunit
VIEVEGNRLRHVAHGVVKVATTGTLAERLVNCFEGVAGRRSKRAAPTRPRSRRPS